MGAEPPANLKILLGDLYLSGILPGLAGFPGVPCSIPCTPLQIVLGWPVYLLDVQCITVLDGNGIRHH